MKDKQSEITPIFIFSLPRSGSTLLQKIIASSVDVSTSSEPWILLPLIYSQKKEGSITEYSHKNAQNALNDVIDGLKSNAVDYNTLLKKYILSVYEGLSNENSKYFLDKTPRYYLIIDEIRELFPKAKFIFLFRNPLSIYASIIERHKGLKSIYSKNIDLQSGFDLLADGYVKHQSDSLKLNYDEIVNNPDKCINEIEGYLGIKISDTIVNDLSKVKLKGQMGDPSLLKNASSPITSLSIDKWKPIFNTLLRKNIARRFLNSIDDQFFECLDKSRTTHIKEVDSVKIKLFAYPKDFYHLLYNKLVLKSKIYLILSKRRAWTRNIFLD